MDQNSKVDFEMVASAFTYAFITKATPEEIQNMVVRLLKESYEKGAAAQKRATLDAVIPLKTDWLNDRSISFDDGIDAALRAIEQSQIGE